MSASSLGLSKLLRLVAEGHDEFLFTLLRELLAIRVTIPLDEPQTDDADPKYRRVYLEKRETHAIPAFTDDSAFAAWTNLQGDAAALRVFGSELHDRLGKAAWLVLNPGGFNEIVLTPAEVQRLAQLSCTSLRREDAPTDDATIADAASASVQPTTVEGRIRQIIEGYPEIEEAFLHDVSGEQCGTMLGLLVKELSPDRRFRLIAQVADVSRECCGFAGAIEVYDDLCEPTASSWDLFSPLTPFFVRAADGDGGASDTLRLRVAELFARGKSSLSSQITRVSDPSHSPAERPLESEKRAAATRRG
ncbi:MAG: SseB family protein [Bdellovibrionales bacterium]|nr:SseB family protein [Bdellovibrionales bacterium]